MYASCVFMFVQVSCISECAWVCVSVLLGLHTSRYLCKHAYEHRWKKCNHIRQMWRLSRFKDSNLASSAFSGYAIYYCQIFSLKYVKKIIPSTSSGIWLWCNYYYFFLSGKSTWQMLLPDIIIVLITKKWEF